jgi:hypothetical protein
MSTPPPAGLRLLHPRVIAVSFGALVPAVLLALVLNRSSGVTGAAAWLAMAAIAGFALSGSV